MAALLQITPSQISATQTCLCLSLFLSVDDLLKEAKVGPNGMMKYEEFVRIICLPTVDY